VMIETQAEPTRPVVDLKPLIADAVERIVKAETEKLSQRADKAMSDPVKFFEWAQGWFDKQQRGYVTKVMAPLLAADGRGLDPESFTTEYIDASIQEFASKQPGELIEDWKQHKAARVAAIIEEQLCTTTS
jgi:hypothetical protein